MADKRPRRYIFIFILILLIGSTGIFLTKTDAGFTIVYRIIQKQIDSQYGLNLSIENISSRVRTNIQADKLEFANADSSVIIKVDTRDINYNGIFEFFGRGHLDSLRLIEPDIYILLNDNGTSEESELSEIKFPKFLIQHIRVEKAHLHIQTADTLIHQKIDDFKCFYSGKNEGARIRIDDLDIRNEALGLEIKDLSSDVSIKNDIAKLRNLKFYLNDSEVSSQGKIRYMNPQRFQVNFSIKDLRIEEYLDLPLIHEDDRVDLDVDLKGNFNELTALVAMEGLINKKHIDQSSFRLELKDDYVHVLEATFQNGSNDVNAYGSYGLKDQYLELSLVPNKIRLHDWLDNIPEFDIKGNLRAEGFIDSLVNINYDIVCLELYGIENSNFSGNIEMLGLEEINIDSTNKIDILDGLLTFNGSIKNLNELDLNIRGDINKISGLQIPGVPEIEADTLYLTLKVKGEMLDPDIEMNFNLDSLKYAEISTHNLNVSLFSKNTISEPGGALLISTEDVVIDSFEFGDIQTYVHMQEDSIALDYFDVIHEDYNLSLAGAVGNYRHFKIDKMQGVYQGEEVYLLEPISFTIDEDKYSLSRFDILYRDALLYGSFDVFGDSLQGWINIAGAELNSLPLISTIVDSIAGIMDMNIEIAGSISDPQINLGMQLKRAYAFGLDLEKMRSEMYYQDSMVYVNYLNMQIDDERRIDLKGEMPLYINFNAKNVAGLLPKDSLYAELELEKVRLEKLLPFVLPYLRIVGEADVKGVIRGTINDPIMDAKLVAYEPEVEKIIGDSIRADYHYSNERIYFNDVEVYANNGYYEGNANFYMDLRVQTDQERHQADSSIYVYVEGNDDEMIYLTPFIDPIESLTGDIYTELEMIGSFNESQKYGKVEIDDGVLVIDILGNEIRNITGTGIIDDNIADVHLRGLLPSETYSFANILGFEDIDSNFTVDGTLDLSNLISPRFDVRLQGDQLSIATLDDNVNLTTGLVDMNITGKDTLTITGDVTLSEGSIEYGFNRSAPSETAPPSNDDYIKTAYTINAMIDKVYFRNQLLDVTLNGEMLLQKYPNENNTRMGGELAVTEGFFNYWASVFTLEQGSSLILDQFENNHQLNFIANKEIDDNTIIASITGELNNPEISFTDENAEMSQAGIVSALTVGEIQNVLEDVGIGLPSSGSPGGITLNFETARDAFLALAEVPLEQQARQLGSAGGLDRIDIKGGTNGTYIDETTALVIGGRIGRNFYLTYEASQDDPMNMEFEYRLNNKVAIVGAADMKKVEGAVRLRLQY